MFYTLGKHVEEKKICYFAGKFVDEALRILRLIQNEQPLGQSRLGLITEFTDLRVMAMDYFEKVLKPALLKTAPKWTPSPLTLGALASGTSVPRKPLALESLESGTSPQSRILALEKEVKSLQGKNRRLQDRVRTLEKKFTEWNEPKQLVVAAKQKRAAGKPAQAGKAPKPTPDAAPARPQSTASPRRHQNAAGLNTLPLTRTRRIDYTPYPTDGGADDAEPLPKKPRKL